MDWRKVKTILIFFMLFINLVLGGMLIWREYGAFQVTHSAETGLLELLEQRGMHVGAGVMPKDDAIIRYTLESIRDPERERQLISGIIGESQVQDTGGNLFIYKSGDNTATFWTGGEFSIEAKSPLTYQSYGDAVKDTESILRDWGGHTIPVLESDGTVSVTQTIGGLPVWNAGIVLSVGFTDISGRWIIGDMTPIASIAQTGHDAGYALNKLAMSLDGEHTVTQIEPGYYAAALDPETVRLTPAWKVTLVEGVYILSAVTGETLNSQ